MYRHARILDFALSLLLRQKNKNFVILSVYAFNVFLVASLLLYTDALKKEAEALLQSSPELIVQRLKGGRHDMIPREYADTIRTIRGVRQVSMRQWGYYYDPQTTANYTFMGVDKIPPEIAILVEGEFNLDESEPLRKDGHFITCVIGEGVADARFIGVDDIIPVQGSDGKLYVLKVTGIFRSESSILTNDLVLLRTEDLTTVFDTPHGQCTDMVVHIRNTREVDAIARKIQERLPMIRSISKSQVLSTYEALFGWRSGLMVALLIGSLAAFAILAWDKASGLSADERKSIGVLKAIGWETSDILELKFWEGFVISVLSFLTGTIAAYIHVFFFGCMMFSPIMRGWSVLFPVFRPLPSIDPYKFFIIMFLTVIPYIAATLIPSWKVAITDPDMVMR
ncbi:ABC transporter permease [Desulfoluna limicola]|uniref:ABC transporter permease n=1 Tax=Desulfoluna limicola TaxID=2810562 RepID=A0ABM7PNC0_9BACT|nr:ABC transporter permease [Desulfoluna limicola]BCS98758.1 ABC transporter permease [Desulfoluna limicola]